MLKTYARVYFPGIIFSDDSYKPVESREISEFEWPKMAYAVQFYEREESLIDGELLVGQYKNPSATYYKNAEIMTIEEVRAWSGSRSVLLSNMELNDYKRVVRTSFGQCFPVREDEDVVLIGGVA